MLTDSLMLLIVGLPLAAAVGLALGPLRALALRLAPWAGLPALLTATAVSPGAVVELDWLLLGATLAYDAIARVFLFFSGLVWSMAGLFAQTSLAGQRREKFFFFYLLAMAGNFGICLARDLPSFLFLYSLMGFASFGLVLRRYDDRAVRAARIYMVLLVVGEGLLYAAAVLAAGDAASLHADAIAQAVAASPHAGTIAVLFFAGFAAKAGVFPLHVSLPPAYDAAPAAGGAVLSGAISKGGVLGWLLFLPAGLTAAPDIGPAVMLLGLATVYYGVVLGLVQRTPKAMLAYSSISQIGFMALLIGVGLHADQLWPAAALATSIYALHHGLSKGALFLGARICAEGGGGRWARRLVLAGLLVPSLALAGAPLTTGAVAKHALKASLVGAALPFGPWFAHAASAGAVGTAVLLARFIVAAWPRQPHDEADDGAQPRWGLVVPWAVLVVSVVVVPWSYPWPQMQRLAGHTLTWSAVGSELWPLAVAAVLVAVGIVAARRVDWLGRARLPAGDLFIPLERASLAAVAGVRHTARWIDARAHQSFDWLVRIIAGQRGVLARLQRAEDVLEAWPLGGGLAVGLALLIAVLAWLL